MRIISGQYGGRRFEAPRNLQARPTTDIAKEGLFNILQNRMDMEGILALDLFGGTGSISFELLSRGAERVTCVEMGRQQQQFIQKVAQELHIGRELNLVRGDVFRFLRSQAAVAPEDGLYDLIFADPPYALPQLADIPELILGNRFLKPGGLFILEHGKDQDFSAIPEFSELRTYGAVHFSFFRPD
ncbi:MAG: 16S rRNA (guanine(966)-N(2))-methyltransferase RsmD [Bacteroidales bacterium]|jgi:16S rRNA (guanine(966)-N(2))-methyltransferase RsmD|nr:16S rRNA (guanine(966)-N(2))-methyltransferase RsmD [Bacteroidales bacterium]MBO7379516.1 16S rRNA (guanine(966)-N(2))-methyltransferase RsmD [Bacteroidales bacterium]